MDAHWRSGEAFSFPLKENPMGYYPKAHASRLGTAQVLNYTGNQSAVTTNTFGSETFQCRIASPIAGYYRVDASNAAVGDSWLPANWVEVVQCTPGQTLSWISTSTSTGNITVTELF
jgi:hypothetical protein